MRTAPRSTDYPRPLKKIGQTTTIGVRHMPSSNLNVQAVLKRIRWFLKGRRSRKLRILTIVSLAVLCLVILASALGSIRFNPGYRISRPGAEGSMTSGSAVDVNPQGLQSIVRALVGLMVFLALAAFVLSFFFKKLRKRLIITILSVLTLLFVFSFLWKDNLNPREREQEPRPGTELSDIGPGVPEGRTPEPLVDTRPSEILVTIASVLFVVGLGVVGFLFWRWFRASREESPAQDLSKEARKGLDNIAEGLDVRNAFIRCYIKMTEIVARTKGLERRGAATPREFERTLLEAGLPPADIDSITRFFELARYGHKSLSTRDERKAIQCLETIMRFCEDTGP